MATGGLPGNLLSDENDEANLLSDEDEEDENQYIIDEDLIRWWNINNSADFLAQEDLLAQEDFLAQEDLLQGIPAGIPTDTTGPEHLRITFLGWNYKPNGGIAAQWRNRIPKPIGRMSSLESWIETLFQQCKSEESWIISILISKLVSSPLTYLYKNGWYTRIFLFLLFPDILAFSTSEMLLQPARNLLVPATHIAMFFAFPLMLLGVFTSALGLVFGPFFCFFFGFWLVLGAFSFTLCICKH